MKRQGRKLSDKDIEKIAAKVVKDKGDTSKSDDRYAYEELQNIRSLVEKEVKVKDTRRVVDAIRAYDKSKDASRDATYDTDEGDKENLLRRSMLLKSVVKLIRMIQIGRSVSTTQVFMVKK